MEFSSLKPLVAENRDIKAVFVGGKGGVGKTSCACSIALQFALNHPGKKVLLISTDPAHNVSDAFIQQFSGKPENVHGCNNLFACEVDPAAAMQEELEHFKVDGEVSSEEGSGYSELESFVTNLPGIDEAMAISSLMNYFDNDNSQNQSYDLVVFDTAPTGHTLRLLQLPALLKLGLQKLTSWKAKFASLFSSMSSVFYADQSQKIQQEKTKRLEERMQVWLSAATKLSEMFKDNVKTQFVCVCNASFLSVYETKRLVNELEVASIKVEYILVNMLMPVKLAQIGTEETTKTLKNILSASEVGLETATLTAEAVSLCGGLSRMQSHYLKVLRDGNDMKIVGLPLLNGEIRGLSNLTSFSERMITIDSKLDASSTDNFSSMDLKVSSNDGYAVETGAKLMSKSLFEDKPDSKQKEPEIPTPALTPEMMGVIQGLITNPAEFDSILSNPLVVEMRQLAENKDLDQFFLDIKAEGFFAGFKYLQNESVMGKLAKICKLIYKSA